MELQPSSSTAEGEGAAESHGTAAAAEAGGSGGIVAAGSMDGSLTLIDMKSGRVLCTDRWAAHDGGAPRMGLFAAGRGLAGRAHAGSGMRCT